ncbi:MAG TPA: hypothetical protein VHA13_05070, partial [Gammaproteobacteria bacterium]|nr:hypothetical protein [Gammaproteobacteria bacterium]
NEKTIFLNPAQRDAFRVIIKNGSFYTRSLDNNFIYHDTQNNFSHFGKGFAAFTLNMHGELSVFNHTGGDLSFYHSSLNAQSAVFFAGEIKITNGKIIEITSHSGHYQPNKESMLQLLHYLKRKNVDLSETIINLYFIDPKTHEAIYKTYNANDFIHHPNDAAEIRQIQSDSFSEFGSDNWANFDSLQGNSTNSSTTSDPFSQSSSDFSNATGEDNWSSFDSSWNETKANSPAPQTTDDELSTSESRINSEPEDWVDFSSINKEINANKPDKDNSSVIYHKAISQTFFGTNKQNKSSENNDLTSESPKKLYK